MTVISHIKLSRLVDEIIYCSDCKNVILTEKYFDHDGKTVCLSCGPKDKKKATDAMNAARAMALGMSQVSSVEGGE